MNSNQMVMTYQNQDQEFVVLLDDMLNNVRSIDDLFFFFGKTFPDLRESLIAQSTSGGVASQQSSSLTYDGSQLDLFIRRCNLSFNQLMFPDLQRLYEAFLLYKEG